MFSLKALKFWQEIWERGGKPILDTWKHIKWQTANQSYCHCAVWQLCSQWETLLALPRFQVYFVPNSSSKRLLSFSASFCCRLCSVLELWTLFFLSLTSRQFIFARWPKKPPSSRETLPWLSLRRWEGIWKAREHGKFLIRTFSGKSDLLFLFFRVRRENSFSKNKEKFTKMRKPERSNETSRNKKMLQANWKELRLWQRPPRYDQEFESWSVSLS